MPGAVVALPAETAVLPCGTRMKTTSVWSKLRDKVAAKRRAKPPQQEFFAGLSMLESASIYAGVGLDLA